MLICWKLFALYRCPMIRYFQVKYVCYDLDYGYVITVCEETWTLHEK